MTSKISDHPPTFCLNISVKNITSNLGNRAKTTLAQISECFKAIRQTHPVNCETLRTPSHNKEELSKRRHVTFKPIIIPKTLSGSSDLSSNPLSIRVYSPPPPFNTAPDTPIQTLEEELSFWSNNLQQSFPHTADEPFWMNRTAIDESNFSDLDFFMKSHLIDYLSKLRKINIYQNFQNSIARQNTLLRVDRMLQLMSSNKEFKNTALELIAKSTTSESKILVALNDIEIQWQVHQIELSDNDKTIATFSISAQRYEELKKFAQKLAHKKGIDEAKVVLYFHLSLQDLLNLPIATCGIQVPQCTGINESMLFEAFDKISNLSNKDLLKASAIWQKRIRSSTQIEKQKS